MEPKPDRMTTRDVEQALGVPKSTIKVWVHAVGLDVPKDSSGAWRWTPELVEELQRVKVLRELEDRSLETIRRVIGATRVEAEQPVGTDREVPGKQPEAAPRAATASTEPAGHPPGGAREVPGNFDALAPLVAALERMVAEPRPALEQIAGAVGDAVAERVTVQLVEALRRETELAEKYARAAHRVGELEASLRANEAERDRLAGELAEARRPALAPARPWWKVWG